MVSGVLAVAEGPTRCERSPLPSSDQEPGQRRQPDALFPGANLAEVSRLPRRALRTTRSIHARESRWVCDWKVTASTPRGARFATDFNDHINTLRDMGDERLWNGRPPDPPRAPGLAHGPGPTLVGESDENSQQEELCVTVRKHRGKLHVSIRVKRGESDDSEGPSIASVTPSPEQKIWIEWGARNEPPAQPIIVPAGTGDYVINRSFNYRDFWRDGEFATDVAPVTVWNETAGRVFRTWFHYEGMERRGQTEWVFGTQPSTADWVTNPGTFNFKVRARGLHPNRAYGWAALPENRVGGADGAASSSRRLLDPTGAAAPATWSSSNGDLPTTELSTRGLDAGRYYIYPVNEDNEIPSSPNPVLLDLRYSDPCDESSPDYTQHVRYDVGGSK